MLPYLLFFSIKALSFSPFFTEKIYGEHLFPFLTIGLRGLLGLLPVSLGDLLYAMLVCLILYVGSRWIIRKIQNRQHPFQWKQLLKWSGWLLFTYTLMWGLQYARSGLTEKWELPAFRYGKPELIELNQQLISSMNQLKSEISKKKATPESISWQTNTKQYYKSFTSSNTKTGLPDYSTPSVKSSLFNVWMSKWGISSLFNVWMSKWGISGYYNPFTAEAQINTTYPACMIPFSACHEVAHQLGIAREQEANLLALVVAESSTDNPLRYSAAFHLFLYANAQLVRVDSNAAYQLNKQINQEVKADFAEYSLFVQNNKSIVEPIVMWIYNQFLIQQGQVRGMNSYQDVVGLWLAYKRKFK
jgi:hypothetical protein